MFATRVSPALLRSAYVLTGDHGQAEDLPFDDGPYRVTSRSTLRVGLQRRGFTTQILPFVPARTTG